MSGVRFNFKLCQGSGEAILAYDCYTPYGVFRGSLGRASPESDQMVIIVIITSSWSSSSSSSELTRVNFTNPPLFPPSNTWSYLEPKFAVARRATTHENNARRSQRLRIYAAIYERADQPRERTITFRSTVRFF